MNRTLATWLVTLSVLVAWAPLSAVAAPIGLTASLELGVSDLLEAEDGREFYLQPELSYLVGTTGLTVGINWWVPFYPDPYTGSLEAWQEYELLFSELYLEAGNSAELEIADGEVDGWLYALVGHPLWEFFLVELEVGFGYGAATDMEIVPGISYEREIGPGSLLLAELDLVYALPSDLEAIVGLGCEQQIGPGTLYVTVEQYVGLYDEVYMGDTEIPVSYELEAGGFTVTAGIEAVVTSDQEFVLGASVLLERFL